MTLQSASRKDRWLLPYADFVTLLFAVFVMMYAAEKSRDKQRVVAIPAQPSEVAPAAAVAPAAVPEPVPAQVLPPPPPDRTTALLTDLQANLGDQGRIGLLTLSADLRGVVIALNDQTLFKAGEAGIQPSAEPALYRIGDVLSRYPNHILLEGHTDSVPIHTDRFRSNWELSTARSIAVMQLLEQHSSMPASRFSIGGSADNSPVTADSSEPGRARNRRVEIIVLNSPAPVPPGEVKSAEPSRPSPE